MPVRTVVVFLALLTILADLVLVALAVGGRRLRGLVAPNGLAAAWGVAVVATLGSLYLSEIAGWEPCELCWYQRIAMYPLAVVLGVALLHSDSGIRRYGLPLSLVGAAIALFHYVLQLRPGLGEACGFAFPCSAVLTRQFGFITIPFMALSAFLLISALLAAVRPR